MMKKLSNWLVMPVQEMMESEKTFMSNASHELKTPLSVISASTELLMDEVGEKKYLKNIQQETEHMIKLVNRMLTLLRLDAPYNIQEYQKFSVDELIFNVCYPLESVAYEKGIRMELDVASDISMTGDLEQIRSVVSILVDNAISYTNSGGKIRIQARRDNEKIMILVANTGEPIPEQLREQLFERYFRNDFSVEASEGHFGLGLSIAGRVVENHHGSIRVYSTDGENIFEVLLPVCEVRSNVLFGFLL
jgi:signal transduction histidine kinase